jgi:hypothetical protein
MGGRVRGWVEDLVVVVKRLNEGREIVEGES